MQTIVAGNLFVVHFSIECNIAELYILRNSWSLARPIRVFLKIKNMIEFLIASLIDPPPLKNLGLLKFQIFFWDA